MNPAAPAWVAAVRGSHERLRALVGRLTQAQLVWPAYPQDWTIAQVMGHLGAGAEEFIGRVNAPAEVVATGVELDTLRSAFPGF